MQLRKLSDKVYPGGVLSFFFLRSSGSTLDALHRIITGRKKEELVWREGGGSNKLVRGQVSVGRDGASAQAAARQALEDAHGDVHEGAKVEEQIVEGVDGQAAGLVRVL